jgi:serine/threonine protein kinase/tetratricopeptide (TPR) repeat protein
VEALRERFGKYHVLDKIAQGGMAEVYKVKTVGIAGFEKVQALKRILPSSAREGRFIRSFIDEARIAVELTHRNIVQVFDFGKADGELFMAMELIEGRDLRTAMTQATARGTPCPTAVAAYIMSEVAAGLDYAHRKTDHYGAPLGIVHCDVSPSNVMLSTDGYVKILDFGIARATFASALERRRLRGKPRYMAPEQTLGEAPTSAADVFALGIIAWELFTGSPLFRGNDIKTILEAVRRTDPPRIDRMNPNVPKEIVDAVATALCREPTARGTAADLQGALARTAMAAGARQLSIWLDEVDAKATDNSASWPSLPSSINVAASAKKPPTEPAPAVQGPPLRPSTRSLTGSVVGTPPAPNDFGEGTPGFRAATPTPTGVRVATEPMRPPTDARLQTEPMTAKYDGVSSTGQVYHAFGDRDPTASVTAVGRYAFDAGQTTPATGFHRDPTQTNQRWGQGESTAAGVGRLQDAFDAYEPANAPGDDVIPPPAPRTYEPLVSLQGSAASMRFDDDDATQFGVAAPPAASFSDFQVEDVDDLVIGGDEPHDLDEAIDDDLGALVTGALAERRRAVVVAALLEGAPPEVLRPIAKSVGELAYQRGGVVLRIDDDALIVAFGLEVAGEDDVAVAMGWALDASAMTRDAGTDVGGVGPVLKIGARTGVSTSSGSVAPRPSGTHDVPRATGTGDVPRASGTHDVPRGSGSDLARSEGRARRPSASQDAPLDGEARMSFVEGAIRIAADAMEDARALARDAAPDRPLFVGAAGRMTSGLYQLREVPPPKRIRRGKVIEVVGPRGIGERDRANLERRGKFIGRTAQLAELEAWFQRAIAADRRLTALISGAAGTGKSRLIAELLARRAATGSSMRTIFCTANPASRNAPFACVIDLYQAALGLPPIRGRSARAQVVQRLLHRLKESGVADERARAITTDLDRAMELRDGVGVGTPEVADLRPRISAGLMAFRAAMSDRTRPLLTVLEDIHNADSASLDVLRHALSMTALGPELMILTARPDGPPPPAVDLVINVGDLVGGDLRALIADRLGDAATPLNIAAVIARGGGNPLFIEELAGAVREAGEDVPATARDVVAARVDRLTPKAKLALRVAAVLGGPMRRALLEELMAAEEPDDGSGANASALDELVEAGILVRPESTTSADTELQFARGLIREVIYDSLSARAQREMHARVGRLLASRFFAGREEPPAVIAEHMERGGELAAAAAFWLRAGKLALDAFDAAAAVAHFSRTLQIERELGAMPATATSRARRRQAFAGREEAHRMAGDLVSDAGDLDELARLAEGDPRRLGDVAVRRAQRLLRLGDYQAATASTVVAEDQAIVVDDARMRGEALRVRGEILERLGRFDEALVVVGDASELFASEGAIADEMAALVGRGRIHLMRAHYEAARDAYRPVIARIEKTGDPYLERIVQNHLAIIEMCLGNYQTAIASAERSLELCRRYGDRAREGDALSVAGIILLEVGLYDQAAERFGAALDILSRTASRWSRADCLIYAGVCDVKRGRAGGLAMIDEALAEARRLGARYLEANALISRAGVQLQRGELAAAVLDAGDGALVARLATLVGYEIQGLARQAAALVRSPDEPRLAEAQSLVQRALALLERQRYLEGSEEEVYANCAAVLAAIGATDNAAFVRARGKAEVERKLAALTDPAWRAAYAAIPENQKLLA